MNTQEFLTQLSATEKEKEILEIISSASPLLKLEGLFDNPLDLLRSSYLDNPYLRNVLLQDFSGDHFSFRPYVKALKGLKPEDPKGLSILTFMMALSIEVKEPLVQRKILYPFRNHFVENTEESFGLYCYLLYFSLAFDEYPALKTYDGYAEKILKACPVENFPEQFSVMQFLFQGNPLQIGKGNSGGLSTFLLQLGKALTHSMKISQVFTLFLKDISKDDSNKESSYHLIQTLDPNHYSLSIPFHLGEDSNFINNHSFLKAMVSVVLDKLQLNPNIYHVRYLNDASLAMAKLGREKNRSVVLTLTPDPHRSMAREDNLKVIGHGYHEGIEKIHKIEVGKKLLQGSHGIIGIGGDQAKEKLLHYYPELNRIPRNKPFQMISEGIDIHLPTKQRMSIEKVLTSPKHEYSIDVGNLSKPYILNVGRLHPLKGQQRLLAAFHQSGAYKKYNLVLIGGNFQQPNEMEKGFLIFEKEYIDAHPELKGSYLHIPGIPNTTVRLIERKINQRRNPDLPNIYFCSSEKEEFGIAILEAMVEGLIAIGPKAGGVSTYIRPGENGFLAETKQVKDIEKSLKEIMSFFEEHPERLQG